MLFSSEVSEALWTNSSLSPASPEDMDWTSHYPAFRQLDKADGNTSRITHEVEIADIGCGFGGLIVALSTLFPETLMLGIHAFETLQRPRAD